MWGWIIGISLLVLLLVAFTGILLWSYRKAFYVPRSKKQVDSHEFFGGKKDEFCRTSLYALVDELEALPFEKVSIRSHDGLRLVGRYYHFSDSNRVEILFNGWRGNAFRDGCGGAKIARDTGYNLLLVDQRAHGESDGNVISFGINEKYDCLNWANYVVERFGKDVIILLGGVSMGAATVLMASSLPLPENVKLITADCPYSSPEAIIRKVSRDMGISDRLGYPFVALGARLFGGFSIRDGGAVEAVKHAKVPIMIMHGEGDDFVPFSMGREIFDACASEKEFLAIPEAGHGLSYFYDTDTYVSAVGEFKKRHIEAAEKRKNHKTNPDQK